jgi:hypothetical protein
VFVYLYRWEWNRALTAGIIYLATEIAVVAALILDRLHAMRDVRASAPRARSRAALTPDGSEPPARDHFAWLVESSSRMSVFIPVLLGAGVLLPGIAWLLERVARAASRPGLEWHMPQEIDGFALPNEPLVGANELPCSDARARLLAPTRRAE